MLEPNAPRNTPPEGRVSFGWMAGTPSGNALTYFRGSIDEAHTFFKERLAAVLTANPCSARAWSSGMKCTASRDLAMKRFVEALSELQTDTSSILPRPTRPKG